MTRTPLENDLVVICEDTTVRGFQSVVRWNQARYRLSQGLAH